MFSTVARLLGFAVVKIGIGSRLGLSSSFSRIAAKLLDITADIASRCLISDLLSLDSLDCSIEAVSAVC